MDKIRALKCYLHYYNSVFKINIPRGLENLHYFLKKWCHLQANQPRKSYTITIK